MFKLAHTSTQHHVVITNIMMRCMSTNCEMRATVGSKTCQAMQHTNKENVPLASSTVTTLVVEHRQQSTELTVSVTLCSQECMTRIIIHKELKVAAAVVHFLCKLLSILVLHQELSQCCTTKVQHIKWYDVPAVLKNAKCGISQVYQKTSLCTQKLP